MLKGRTYNTGLLNNVRIVNFHIRDLHILYVHYLDQTSTRNTFANYIRHKKVFHEDVLNLIEHKDRGEIRVFQRIIPNLESSLIKTRKELTLYEIAICLFLGYAWKCIIIDAAFTSS